MQQQQKTIGTVTSNWDVAQPETNLSAGWFCVGDGHEVYFEEHGKLDADTTIIHIHGGPGANFTEKHLALYDLSVHHVIFFDQRGCGKSTPFAETENNTTQHLIADIELLRKHFGLEKISLVGGSWGSTLSLFYAIAYPERVERILLWSIFLNRQFELDFVNDGRLRLWFPEAWERFVALVPKECRTSGKSIMAFYAKMIRSEDQKVARRYADEWTLWEATLLSLNYDPAKLEEETVGDERNVAIASLETHYFLNDCFVEEDHILLNLDRIQHIPSDVVHGRFDMCTPFVSALDLKTCWGAQCTLTPVNSGHRHTDPEMFPVLQGILRSKFI